MGHARPSLYMPSQARFVQCLQLVGELPLTPWQIGLARLGDLAFDNIKSQLSEENIVRELFSPFTAQQVVSLLMTTWIPTNLPMQPRAHRRDAA